MTVKVTITEWESDPLVPVTLAVYVPAVEPVQVSVDVPEFVRLDGASLQERAERLVLFVRVTIPVKLWRAVTVIVELAATPTFAETVVGPAVIAKSGPTETMTVNATLVLVLVPEVALMTS